MKIKYVGTSPLDIPSLGVYVNQGDVFEATGDDAKSLLSREDFERDETEKESK